MDTIELDRHPKNNVLRALRPPPFGDAEPRKARTITRNDLAAAVCDAAPGLSRRQAADLIDAVLDELAAALVAGESVRLHKFGRFKVSKRCARLGRNPRTGDAVSIPTQNLLRFQPSDYMLDLVERQAGALKAPDQP